ncbi:SDR family NAD(P)-dependent oxidoreductase [Aquipuribacter nitratireducens]|uniref:SDR family NAD(P)-dependent oxidoreductase n=1 Tax=Aquipuribacter nitratireducens TaxID=650104 RepID=A0ABW0GHJ5_9MICO
MADTDITSPTVLVTGPTRGLGAALVDALAAHRSRPRLVLAGRDPATLGASAKRARATGAVVDEVVVDLLDLDAVAAAAAGVVDAVTAGTLPALDVVVANAGIQYQDRHHTGAQGHEATFTVNVLAQHALVRGLLPALAPAAHVVLLGSSSHRGRAATFGLLPSPAWRDPAELAAPDTTPAGATATAGGRAYADSKLALVTLAQRWARELPAPHRLSVYDPGLVPGTGLGRHMPAYKRWVWENLMPAMQVLPGAASARRSAGHLAGLALGDTHAGLHGAYVELGRVRATAPPTYDRARQDRLWQVCEELTRAVPARR